MIEMSDRGCFSKFVVGRKIFHGKFNVVSVRSLVLYAKGSCYNA